MNKTVGIIVSAIGGIILGLAISYIVHSMGRGTYEILGWVCGIAGFIVLLSLISIGAKQTENVKKGQPKNKGCTQSLYALVFGLSLALGGLVGYSKYVHDRKINSDMTGQQYLMNKGWEEFSVCTAYGESGHGTFYIFSKDDRFIAVSYDAAKGNCYFTPTQYSVTEGDYYFRGKEYNARISINGDFLYFNF